MRMLSYSYGNEYYEIELSLLEIRVRMANTLMTFRGADSVLSEVMLVHNAIGEELAHEDV